MGESFEYEVKIPVDNLSALRDSLKALGYELMGRVEEVDHYLDLTPCVGIRGDDIAYRVRLRRDLRTGRVEGEVTYKGPQLEEGVKARLELSSSVGNPEALIKAYTLMGFSLYRLRKVREIYRRVGESVTIYLDDVEGLGRYVEVEVINPGGKDAYIKALRKVKKDLGLEGKPEIITPYLTMLLKGVKK